MRKKKIEDRQRGREQIRKILTKDSGNDIANVCFLKKGGSSHSRIILSVRDVTITSKGLHILTYTRHHIEISARQEPMQSLCSRL